MLDLRDAKTLANYSYNYCCTHTPTHTPTLLFINLTERRTDKRLGSLTVLGLLCMC